MATLKLKNEQGEWTEVPHIKGHSGKSPYVDPQTGHWMVFNDETLLWEDSQIAAQGSDEISSWYEG